MIFNALRWDRHRRPSAGLLQTRRRLMSHQLSSRLRGIAMSGRLVLVLVSLCIAESGCTGKSSDSAAVGAGTPAAVPKPPPPPEPKPFDEIPLSKDSSYDAPAITPGSMPGEVRKMTALKI